MLLAGIHGSLLLDPMLVLSSRHSRRETRAYAYRCAHLTLGLSVLAIPAAVVWSVLAGPSLAGPVGVTLATFPAILCSWTLRRAPYTLRASSAAALGSFAYFLLVVAALGGFGLASAEVNATRAAVIVGAASTAHILVMRLMWPPTRDRKVPQRMRLADHWQYGRWMLPVSATKNMGNFGLPLIVYAVSGADVAGRLRAALVPATALGLAFSITAVSQVSDISRQVGAGHLGSARSQVTVLARIFGGLGLVSCAAVAAFGEPIVVAVFGQEFTGLRWSLVLVIAAVAVTGVADAAAVGVRAVLEPKRLLAPAVLGTLTAVLGTLLFSGWETTGASLAMLCGALVSTTLVLVGLRRTPLGTGSNRSSEQSSS